MPLEAHVAGTLPGGYKHQDLYTQVSVATQYALMRWTYTWQSAWPSALWPCVMVEVRLSCYRPLARLHCGADCYGLMSTPSDMWICEALGSSLVSSQVAGSDMNVGVCICPSDEQTYTWPGSNWRPSACEADVIATRPQVRTHVGYEPATTTHHTHQLSRQYESGTKGTGGNHHVPVAGWTNQERMINQSMGTW